MSIISDDIQSGQKTPINNNIIENKHEHGLSNIIWKYNSIL